MNDSALILFDLFRKGLWSAVVFCAPILVVATVTGLGVGLFQALTGVQEMTLTFVPKLVVIVLIIFLTLDNMSNEMISFFETEVMTRVVRINNG